MIPQTNVFENKKLYRKTSYMRLQILIKLLNPYDLKNIYYLIRTLIIFFILGKKFSSNFLIDIYFSPNLSTYVNEFKIRTKIFKII